MSQQHAAGTVQGAGVPGSPGFIRRSYLQGLVDTGAGRSYQSLSEILNRRPVRIPQLVDTIDNALTIMDVSYIIKYDLSIETWIITFI